MGSLGRDGRYILSLQEILGGNLQMGQEQRAAAELGPFPMGGGAPTDHDPRWTPLSHASTPRETESVSSFAGWKLEPSLHNNPVLF